MTRGFEWPANQSRTDIFNLLYNPPTREFDPDVDVEPTGEWLDRFSDRLSGFATTITLVDEEGTGLVHWEIDPETGALRGVLPEASGGGSIEERIQEMLERTERIHMVLDYYLKAAMYAVSGGPAAPRTECITAYTKFLVKLYGIASIAIATGRAHNVKEQIRDAVANLLCERATGVGKSAIKFYGNEIIMDALGASMDEEPPSIC